MIDVKTHTKDEIISYLLNNELKKIQKDFYSFIDDNKYNMILSIFWVVFNGTSANLSKSVDYIGKDVFNKYSVKHIFSSIYKNFKVDKSYIIADENKNKLAYLSKSSDIGNKPYFTKDLFLLMDENVFIRLRFKIKNRWYVFTIDRDNIKYRTYKKN